MVAGAHLAGALCWAGEHQTEGPPMQCWGQVWALPIHSARWSFTELTGTAKKPQLKEGLLCEQDAAAQSGPQKKPVTQQTHRLFLLRVKLMHFVNSLHNYIMTRVCISSTSVLAPCGRAIVTEASTQSLQTIDVKVCSRDSMAVWRAGVLNMPGHMGPETAALLSPTPGQA